MVKKHFKFGRWDISVELDLPKLEPDEEGHELKQFQYTLEDMDDNRVGLVWGTKRDTDRIELEDELEEVIDTEGGGKVLDTIEVLGHEIELTASDLERIL